MPAKAWEATMSLTHRHLVASLALAIAVLADDSRADPAPIVAFARAPHVVQVSISPDRRYLAYVLSEDDVRSVVVHDRQNKESKPATLWSNSGKKDRDVAWCGWANATRLVCGTSSSVGRDTARRTNVFRANRLIAFNHDGSDSVVLMKDASDRRSLNQDDILDWTPADPKTVLIALRKGRDDEQAVYKLDVYTSELQEHSVITGHATYASDGAGKARLAYIPNESASMTYYVRLAGQSNWKRWGVFDYLEANDEIEPWLVLPDANRLIGAKLHDGRLALWEADMERKEKPKLLFSTQSRFDVRALEAPRGRLLGVRYDAERPQVHYLDARARSVVEGANRFLPDAFNSIEYLTDDGSAYILRSQSDINAGTFHLLDASSNSGSLEQIGESYPELSKHPLGRMQPVEYAARDGAKIPAYLTLPTEKSESPPPLIVMPHDGPFDRTRWEFDYLRAFLVDRGYAVLEMNYRGSTGYGWEWQKAGYRAWTGKTYEDILDGARWAVSSGVADRDRVCIAGRGYGGYQALLAAAANSDVYRCAISIGAWSSLVDARTYADTWGTGNLKVKEYGTNTQSLLAQSPVRQADRVRVPVLLIHAELDSNVPATQSQAMAWELKQRCKPHEYVMLPDTDQALRWQSDREILLESVDRFLDRNLSGPRKEVPASCGDLQTRAN
jgi:dipeptidyl aminopeptidase/acylaminoacyl peptidase